MKKYSRITEINRGFQYIEAQINLLEKKAIADSGLDITRRELLYVTIIIDNTGKTIEEMASIAGVSKSTFSNQVKLLIKKDIVFKEQDKQDSRKSIIKPTPKGENVFKLHSDIRKHLANEYRDLLTEQEIETLLKIGRKVIKHLDEENGRR